MRKFEENIFLKVGIYSITNIINNKIYIGSTLKTFRVRFNAHINLLKSNKHDNIIIQNSWHKYGEENFVFNIIESFDFISQDELLELEEKYILLYKSLDRNFGYNILHAGKSIYGVKWTEKSKFNRCGENNPMFGKGNLRKGELNPMFGKTLTDLHKKRMSLSLTGIKKPVTSQKLSKAVIMLDKNENIINEFVSAIEAQRITKILHINKVCNGDRKSAGGFL